MPLESNRNAITVACENVDCPQPLSLSLTPTEMSEWIDEQDEFVCSACGKKLYAASLQLECYICGEEVTCDDLNEARHWLGERCPHCAGPHDVDFYSVVVAGSWSNHVGVYDWTREEKDINELMPLNRTDYWEGLVHFCTAAEFVSIYEQRRIVSAPTGYFYKLDPRNAKSVCLTEATIENWPELQKQPKFGEFGYIFRKRDVIKYGGAPAAYFPECLVASMRSAGGEFVDSLKPFVNLLRLKDSAGQKVKHDFLHEREWRVPSDIDLQVLRPFAVLIPELRQLRKTDGFEAILRAAREFHELRRKA